MSFPVDPPRQPVFGVRGWLLLLCIILTVINPVAVLVGIVRPLHHAFAGGVPGRQAVAALLDVMAELAVAGYGVYAGYRLWAVRPKAVLAAKLYFAIKLFFVLLWPWVLLTITGIPRNHLFMVGWMRGVAGAFVAFLIWFFYLLRSRRVANTYFRVT
jgi:hypothetical protein